MTGKLLSKSINVDLIGSVLLSFSKRISELVKPIENNFQESLVNAIKDSALKYSATHRSIHLVSYIYFLLICCFRPVG